MIRTFRIAVAAVLFLASVHLAGCEDVERCPNCPTPPLPQTTPDNVLKNLERAYVTKNPDEYAALLAVDFRFYSDPQTRILKGLPESWNRFDDSTATASLFKCDKVGEIRIALNYDPAGQPVTISGGVTWIRIDAIAWVDVDQKPDSTNSEGITFRVASAAQSFDFRKGRTDTDTLATSPSAGQFFILGWREMSSGPPQEPAADVAPATWGEIKNLNPCNQTVRPGNPSLLINRGAPQ